MCKPLVAIAIATYNHEKFIAQAIESVLNQKTSFPFCAYIGDDASTDKNQEICKYYAAKFPDKIKLLLRTKNNFKENSKAIYAACFNSGAKYVAMLDGDDYWSDENKLQEQIDILEKNENTVLCYHNIGIHDERLIKIPFNIFNPPIQNATTVDIINTHFVPTHSIVFRNIIDFSKHFNVMEKLISGDIYIELVLSLHGTFYHLDKEMAVYRLQDTSFTSPIRHDFSWVKSRLFLYKSFNDISKGKFEKALAKKMIDLLKLELKYILMHETGDVKKNRLKQNRKNAFEFLPFLNALSYYFQTLTFKPEDHPV